jgi:hypothetical protein
VKYYFVFLLMLLNVSIAQADMSDCKAMYVGLLGNNQDAGNAHFALKNSSDDNGGSYAIYFTGWDETQLNRSYSLLLAAKMSGHRVNIKTKALDGCSIALPGQVVSFIQLTDKP